jgi:hypothetical protein
MSTTSGGPNIVTSGLVLYLDAANTQSYSGTGTVWNDLSGNNYNATKGGSQSPTYPQWNSSGYFVFTGGVSGNNYSRFDVSNIPSLTAITIEIFHYSTQSGGHVIRADNSDYQIGPDGYTAGTNFNDISCARLDTLNTWIYDTLTFNGTNLIGYRNGIQYSTKNRGSSTTIASSNARIGTRNDFFIAHYVGNIAFIRMYNRALSAQEVLQNYNAQKSRFGLP